MSKQTKGYRNDLHQLMKPKKRIELPPAAFSNAMNEINPEFDFRNWRQSMEWRVFVAGHKEAIRTVTARISSQYNSWGFQQ